MAESDDKPGVTSQQLAALFDCSPRQIELWAKDGICVRVGRGRYDAANSTRNLVRHLREQAAGRAGIDRDTDVVAANKMRSEEAAALTRTKRMQLEGSLVSVDRVRETWGRMLRGLRQAVLGLPNAIVYEVPTLSAHDLKTIKRIVADLLTDASLGKHVDGGAVGGPESPDATGRLKPLSGRTARGRDVGAAGAAAAALFG